MKGLIALALGAVLMSTAAAKDIAGLPIPDNINVQNTPLVLNGAGVRSKFFVKVYIGALYLPSRQTSTAAILAAAGPKSVRLHFLHSEVSADKLVAAWNDGFTANQGENEQAALKDRIERFNALFPSVRRGDIIRLDMLANGSTEVWVSDNKRGVIEGGDFQQALLKIWLGDKPAQASLKQELLGNE